MKLARAAVLVIPFIVISTGANAQKEKSLSMKEIEALHAKLDECESEYPAFNPPTTLECLRARSKLLAHYGSDDALKEATGMLKAAEAAAKIFGNQSKPR